MKKGIINETLLNNNIKKIEMYATMEKAKLGSICLEFGDISNGYKSNVNNKLFDENIDALDSSINKIYNKRKKCVNILNNVIILYKKLSKQTTQIFNGGNR